jgi:hypothetical protein
VRGSDEKAAGYTIKIDRAGVRVEAQVPNSTLAELRSLGNACAGELMSVLPIWVSDSLRSAAAYEIELESEEFDAVLAYYNALGDQNLEPSSVPAINAKGIDFFVAITPTLTYVSRDGWIMPRTKLLVKVTEISTRKIRRFEIEPDAEDSSSLDAIEAAISASSSNARREYTVDVKVTNKAEHTFCMQAEGPSIAVTDRDYSTKEFPEGTGDVVYVRRQIPLIDSDQCVLPGRTKKITKTFVLPQLSHRIETFCVLPLLTSAAASQAMSDGRYRLEHDAGRICFTPSGQDTFAGPVDRPRGFPRGQVMQDCGCWGMNPVSGASEQGCQSGRVVLRACGWPCAAGGMSYSYVCD